VRQAFHTEIHALNVRGVKHIANMSDPQIPAALAPAVVGIVSLHDFVPPAMHHLRPQFTTSLGYYTVVPADLATIYNLNPLFGEGISGQGQTVVVIEDADVTNGSNNADWKTFRSTFGLSGYAAGSLTQVHPAPTGGGSNCAAPGVNSNDVEATLDMEYASAAAPSAAIELASCADTGATFGGLIAMQNIINASGTPPAIMSVSYGECEAENGAGANAAYNSTYQQAVTEGVSVFVAAGDFGAAGCDPNAADASHGIGVSGFASTPYNVAVGGTDFADTYENANSTYWSSTNSASYGSALSYVPEIPWNNSCAGNLLATYYGYTPEGLCNSIVSAFGGYNTTVAGGGGPSQCATGSPSTPGVVGGSCAGYAKPAWQSIAGNPGDGVRDTPDVSLFAANGVWYHYYIFCFSDASNGGTACTGDPSNWTGAGGTSFSAPILAGMQALVNQKVGGAQGNPNPVYYKLAATEYGTGGSAACDSNANGGPASSCIFYDITKAGTTAADMVVDCAAGSPDCSTTTPGDAYGILYDPSLKVSAYGSGTGWDLATGIGSVNAYNLVNAWPVSTSPDFSLSASPSSITVVEGTNKTSTVSVNDLNGFSGSVSFGTSGTLPNGITVSFSPGSSKTSTTATITASASAAAGTNNVTITGTSGALVHQATIAVTVPPPSFNLSASPTSVTITQGSQGSSKISISPVNGFSGNVSFTNSALPSGWSVSYSPNPASYPANPSTTATFMASANATTETTTVTVTGTSGAVSNQVKITVTVNAGATPNFTLSASPSSLTIHRGNSGTSTITVNPVNGFSGSVSLSASGLPRNVTASFSPSSTTTTSTLTLTASRRASTGTKNVTVTGKSGALSQTVTISVTIQ
jgi:subtilase family serine protease